MRGGGGEEDLDKRIKSKVKKKSCLAVFPTWFCLDSSMVGDWKSPWLPIPPESFKFKSSGGMFGALGFKFEELVFVWPRSCATRACVGEGEDVGERTEAGLGSFAMFWETGGRTSLLTRGGTGEVWGDVEITSFAGMGGERGSNGFVVSFFVVSSCVSG